MAIGFFAATLAVTCAVDAANSDIDFGRDVHPILAEHCLECHGADDQQGGLRLDQRAAALAVLESGNKAIVAGNAGESHLLQRVRSSDPETRMPPEGEPLSAGQIRILEKWIVGGAQWETHWAYTSLTPGPMPILKGNQHRANGPIDRYVLRQLESRNIRPSPIANRYTLIKRLHLDLLGIPPNKEDVDRFVADKSPHAYERLVDRLLASPRFGERWGRHWLDKARYADSDGYEKDRNRPHAWHYRDWVIQSINADMPFDQFTTEQLAGDLLDAPSQSQVLATAFHRQTLTNTEGGTDQEQWRVAAVMDRTETLGAIWLGLTVGCARCHNHKYDQISQAEYYQLFAFFNNGDEVDLNLPPTSDDLVIFQKQLADFETKVAEQARLLQHRQEQLASKRHDLENLNRPRSNTSEAFDSKPVESKSVESEDSLAKQIAVLEKEIDEQTKQLANLRQSKPQEPVRAVRVLGERQTDRRTTHILRRGEFKQPLDEVQSATLATLTEQNSDVDFSTENARRDLAKWLVNGNNPLVPRVTVNHIWTHLFGVGLVTTPNDFGVRGERPSHPQLLDYLAGEYVRLGWSRKAIVRQILLSATYRQSSAHRPKLADVDPANRLLYRQNRFRLEAEIIRDATLAAAGLLSSKICGPSVFPPMPPEAAAVSYANNFKWQTSSGEDRYRRGLYTFFKRTAPHPTMTTFDCPDANVTNVQRNRSNTPIGALVLLNNEVYGEAAIAMAARFVTAKGSDDDRVVEIFQSCLARTPTIPERQQILQLLEKSRNYYQQNIDAANDLVAGQHALPNARDEQAAWAVVSRVILNLDEFVTRD